MAAQTAVNAQHATLSGSTADSVTFSGQGSTLAVTNRHASNVMYFKVIGSGASAITAAADDTLVVLAGTTKTITAPCVGSLIVSIVGTDNPYSAEIF